MAQAPRRRRQTATKLYRWKWTGTGSSGRRVNGSMVSASKVEVGTELRRQAISVKRITKKSGGQGRIKPRDIALFARQMATMIRADIPLLQAFQVVTESIEKPVMVAMVRQMTSDVMAGSSFSDALRRHPQHFDPLFVNLVGAGEQSGALDEVLERIATYKEGVESLKARVKKAMWYPAAVMAVGIGVTILLLVKVVPQFEAMFNSFGAELPALTQLVLNMSESVQKYWLHFIGAIAFAVVAFRYMLKRSEKLAYRLDSQLLMLPVIGDILDKSAVARFSRTLATIFSAGIPLVEGLATAAGATGNRVYEQAVLQARDDVTTGRQLNFAIRMTNQFPTQVVQMVSIGEESGALDAMLNRVADYYEEQVSNKVDTLTSLMEPFIIVILGALVGFVIIAMYMPLFSMGDAI